MEYKPTQTNQMSARDKLLNIIWCIINSTIFRITPSKLGIFRKIRIFLLRMFGAEADWHASIHPSAKIEYPWNIKIGKESSLGEKSWVYAMTKVEIGDNTCIGKDVYLMTGTHDVNSPEFNLIMKPITIGDGAWIATDAKILPGVCVGDMAVVGAGAVVTKNVQSWTIVGGNPAKYIKKRTIIDKGSSVG